MRNIEVKEHESDLFAAVTLARGGDKNKSPFTSPVINVDMMRNQWFLRNTSEIRNKSVPGLGRVRHIYILHTISS